MNGAASSGGSMTTSAPSVHISSTQWGFTACCFIMGTILRSVMINSIMDNEAWLTSITGAIAFLPLMLVFLSLTRRFPNKNLFEIADITLGPVGGFIVGILLVIFYVMLAMLNMMEIGSFVTGYLIQGTPFLAVMVAAALASVYMLMKGIGALTRLIPAITIIASVLLLINWGQSLSAANYSYLLPLFQKPAGHYVHATLIDLAVPYGESLTMFTLMPMVRQGEDMKRPMLGTLAFTCVIMMLVHIRETVILGPLLTYIALPTYEVMRMIDAGSSFARTESIFAIELLTLSFVKATVILYALTRGIAHITRIDRTSDKDPGFKAILLPVSLFIAIYSTTFHGVSYNNIEWYVNLGPIIWLTFEAAIPIIMWLTAMIRGQRKVVRE